jgi:hypothetical protein
MLLLICISAIQCTASKAFRLGVPSAAWGDVILGARPDRSELIEAHATRCVPLALPSPTPLAL